MSWERVSRSLVEMEDRLRAAESEEQCQIIGGLAREILISLAQAVYDPYVHTGTVDGVAPSETDAKRMLDAYIEKSVPGSSNEEIRRFAKSVIALAPAVAHKRTATLREARLCAVATKSMVRVVEVLADRTAAESNWAGVEVAGRYFAWEGDRLHSLEDRPGRGAPKPLEDALRGAGMTPSYGNRDLIPRHLAKGAFQVYETDKKIWRREMLYTEDGAQVLLATPVVIGKSPALPASADSTPKARNERGSPPEPLPDLNLSFTGGSEVTCLIENKGGRGTVAVKARVVQPATLFRIERWYDVMLSASIKAHGEVTVHLLDTSSNDESVYLKGIGSNWTYVEAQRMPRDFQPLLLEVRCLTEPRGQEPGPVRVRITYERPRSYDGASGRFRVARVNP